MRGGESRHSPSNLHLPFAVLLHQAASAAAAPAPDPDPAPAAAPAERRGGFGRHAGRGPPPDRRGGEASQDGDGDDGRAAAHPGEKEFFFFSFF